MLVKFNETRLLGFNGRMIIPGINDLPAEFVAEMQDDSILAHKFDNGHLEIIQVEGVKRKKGQELSAVDRFLAAAPGDAKELLGSLVDLAVLEEWLSREKRVPLRKLIKIKISKIKKIEYRNDKHKEEDVEEDADEE